MLSSWRGLRLIAAACLLAAVVVPAPAFAQRVVSVVPFTFGSVTMNASARHVVHDTAVALLPDDVDGELDIYVHTVSTGSLRRLPRSILIGVPDAMAIFDVLSISDDGRYLAYLTRRYGNNHLQLPPVLARYDLQTGERIVIRDAAHDAVANPSMSRDGSTFAWIGANNAVHVATVGQTALVVGTACPAWRDDCALRPALSADGSRVLYLVNDGSLNVTGLETFDRRTNSRAWFPEAGGHSAWYLATDATGRFALMRTGIGNASLVLDLESRRVEQLPILAGAISTDGRYLSVSNGVYDRRSSSLLSPGGDGTAAMSADGRQVLVRFPGQHLLLDLDGDDDGMRDPWESVYGLDPGSATDADGDPDADGVTNRQEFDAGSHPRGTYRRAFAEGVQGSGFATTVHLMTSIRAYGAQGTTSPLVVSFLGDDGSSASRTMSGWVYPTDDGVATVPGLVTSTSFSILVESQAPFAAERRTTWGGSVVRGMHGTGGAVPSTRWYFAEGATTGRFQLFYLLGNQGSVPAAVTIDYLLASGERVVRDYVVPARSRHTIWVNQEGGPLGSAEVAARITSLEPIVAERAMYMGDAAGGFGAGASAAGAAAPARSWLFAEGATGPLFDTFLTLLNPGEAPVVVAATYRLPDGSAVERTHMVPAGSRRTIWVDEEDPRLSDATFATRLEADGDLVAERAMWWRTTPGAPWTEGHAETGATAMSPVWLAPNVGESDFVLIANHSTGPARVRVTLYTHAGGGAASAVYDIPAGSRVTSWPVQDMGNGALPPGRYEAIVESLTVGGEPRAGLVVEVAAYTPGLRAGTVSLATPLPDAPERQLP